MIYKRNGWWHADFTVNGVRYRRALGTEDRRKAISLEKELSAAATVGTLSTQTPFAKLTFDKAFDEWAVFKVDHGKHRWTKNTLRTMKERAKSICKRLGAFPVDRLTPGHVHKYLSGRRADGIANATLNRELDVIRGILKHAKRWHLFAGEVAPYDVTENIGRVLSPTQKSSLLAIAQSRPEWETAYLAAVIALNTTARSIEIKNLLWKDVDLLNRMMVIRRSKTKAGERAIPLNDGSFGAFAKLRARAERLGAARDEHHVFPACEHGKIDPLRAQTSWRTSWRFLTRAIHCRLCATLQQPGATCRMKECGMDLKGVVSPTAGLRFHDLRHDAITSLAEGRASDHVIMSISGHLSKKMLEHYSQIRIDAKRDALAFLNAKPSAEGELSGFDGGRVTKHVTTPSLRPYDSAGDVGYVPENIGDLLVELSGIEPLTSSLRTRRSPS